MRDKAKLLSSVKYDYAEYINEAKECLIADIEEIIKLWSEKYDGIKDTVDSMKTRVSKAEDGLKGLKPKRNEDFTALERAKGQISQV